MGEGFSRREGKGHRAHGLLHEPPLTQIERGDFFLLEHPAHASSWELDSVEKMMSEQGVDDTVADQCMYGLVTPHADRTELVPAKKPTRCVSNSWHVLGNSARGATSRTLTSH